MRTKKAELLGRIDSYISFLRYGYAIEEQLNRLETISKLYSKFGVKYSEEKLNASIYVSESLSKELVLPLPVKGVFLTEGKPKRRFYLAEELRKSVGNPINSSFPLMLDHKRNEAGKIVGRVDKIKYDDSIKGIRWWGHVNDETVARNILDNSITQVSATIFAVEEFNKDYGIVGRDLTYPELSLVLDGAEPNNSIEVGE